MGGRWEGNERLRNENDTEGHPQTAYIEREENKRKI